MWHIAFGLAAVLLGACNPILGIPEVVQGCTTDQQCASSTQPGGRCEPGAGACAFPDGSCGQGGYRFGDGAGNLSGQCVGAGPGSGSSDGGTPPPPDNQLCFGTSLVKVCLQSPPIGTFSPGATTIDTTPGMSQLCAPLTSGGDLCVIAATTIAINEPLQGVGTRPLVLLASQSITVMSTVDVGSRRTPHELIGAGATTGITAIETCAPGTKPSSGKGGGGAGGSFTGRGGAGGSPPEISAGGASGTTVPATPLRGGCPGQPGDGTVPLAGVGGNGGGAVYLIAQSITVHGGINAGGEGGAGAMVDSDNGDGAGGGGSGGMIGFDAPSITVTGTLSANGGGGGQASSQVDSGGNGADATTVAAAVGGTGAGLGGVGGNGSSGAAAGPGAKGSDGGLDLPNFGDGGGGGGGAGVIKGPAASLGAKVSPAATP